VERQINEVKLEGTVVELKTFQTKKGGVLTKFRLNSGSVFATCLYVDKSFDVAEGDTVIVHGNLGIDQQRKSLQVWVDGVTRPSGGATTYKQSTGDTQEPPQDPKDCDDAENEPPF